MYAIPFDLVVANTKEDHPKASLRPTRISVLCWVGLHGVHEAALISGDLRAR
jgi:hypothetical protein